MGRWLALILVLVASRVAYAQEYDAVVQVREVEVRSGPSASEKFYATGKLRLGDKVHVKGNHGDYVAIEPPLDAFSLVPKQAVREVARGQGVITVESADTYQGSTLVGDCNVKGTRLVLGTQVSILEEVQLKSNLGPAAFYKIVPLNESRYLPADAIRKQGVVPAGGAGHPPSAGGVQPAGGVPSDQIGAWLVKADNEYRRGQYHGDFTEAKRLYDELLRCDDHQARGIAQVRLSYIKKYAPHLFQGSNAGAANPAGPAPARYTSGPATSFDHARSGAGVSPAKATHPPASSSAFRPNPPAAEAARGGNVGVLKRANTREQGRQVYYLVDEQGRTKFYLAAATGVDLESFVEQKIEITGGPLVYRPDLNGHYLVAVWARRAP
jgi:hypothetical protein